LPEFWTCILGLKFGLWYYRVIISTDFVSQALHYAHSQPLRSNPVWRTIVGHHGICCFSQGTTAFMSHWIKSVITTWPIAFPAVLVVAPLVRKLVLRITDE
jgi:hypothetical protein